MKTYNQIISIIKSEISLGNITSVQSCRNKIEELCIKNDCMNNMFAIAYEMGVA